jgi:hypothetical protein
MKRDLSWCLPVILVIAFLLPLKLWRASREGSIWVDERATLALVQHRVSEIPALTLIHRHPPAYLYAVKAWLRLGRELQVPAGILWARSLNVVLWVLLVISVYFLGRRSSGNAAAALMVWAVGGSSQIADITKELRSYALAGMCICIAFLSLSAILNLPEKDRCHSRKLWALYAICATLALYTDYSSSVAFSFMLLAWLVISLLRWRKRREKWIFREGFAVHLTVILVFAPWIIWLGNQAKVMATTSADWRTPHTLANLGKVFAIWYPFGQINPSRLSPALVAPAIALGTISFLLPICAAAVRKRAVRIPSSVLSIGIAALALSVSCVLTIWFADRLGIATSFDGPRYTSSFAALWAIGLASFASYSTGGRTCAAILIIGPWFLCASVGQAWTLRHESWHNTKILRNASHGLLPPPGSKLYVMPWEFAPYHRNELKEWHLLPAAQITSAARNSTEPLSVIRLSPWRAYDRPENTELLSLIESRKIRPSLETAHFPRQTDDFVFYKLE